MLSLLTLTEADIRGVLTAQSLRRAYGYVSRVRDEVRTGSTLTARVPGTRMYSVMVEIEPDGITAECSCPYDWGGFCKHVGAVLLAWLQRPKSFTAGGPEAPADDYATEVIPVEPPPTQPWDDLPFWLTTSVEDVQLADQRQLGEWLLKIKLVDLRQMARNRAWRVQGTRKADIVRQIAALMVDSDDMARAVEDLGDEQRLLLYALLLLGTGSRMPEKDLERVLKAWGGRNSDQPVSIQTRRLWKMGLALPGYTQDRGSGRDFVPLAIARGLPPLVGSVTADLPTQAGGDGLCLADPSAMIRTAIQIALLLEKQPVALRIPLPRPAIEKYHPQLQSWDYVLDELVQAERSSRLGRQSGIKLTVPPPRRSLPNSAVERLVPISGGEAQLEFAYSLLVTAGVFQPGSPTTVCREVKAQFLHRDESAQRAVLARAYFHMQNWSVLWELLWESNGLSLMRDSRYSYYTPENLRADLRLVRHLVLRVLSVLPDETWLETRALCRLVRTVWPVFDQTVWDSFRFSYLARSGRGLGAWFLTKDGQPLSPESEEDWDLAQGNFVRHTISSPLHWLGLADLHYDGGELVSFRLHGLGDLYWDRVQAPVASRPVVSSGRDAGSTESITTSDLTISVDPAAISPGAHSLLDEIARLDKAGADCFLYRLDPQAAFESFESGVTLAGILENWEQQFPIPVPDPIRERLHTWWEVYGRVRIYEDLTIVEFGDDYALAEMKAVSSLDSYVVTEISPRLVIIQRDAVTELTAELVRAGYTPKVEDRAAGD
jgi:hypothetical protein